MSAAKKRHDALLAQTSFSVWRHIECET